MICASSTSRFWAASTRVVTVDLGSPSSKRGRLVRQLAQDDGVDHGLVLGGEQVERNGGDRCSLILVVAAESASRRLNFVGKPWGSG